MSFRSTDKSANVRHMVDVSVVTASYNAAATLERCIRSVESQSSPAREHIIVDDGSTDDTAEVLRRLQEELPNLRLIRQTNRGAGAARNAGIAEASGRYIAFLDSDDYWTPHKLEAQIRYMTSHRVAFSYGDYDSIDPATEKRAVRITTPDRLSHDEFLGSCPIGCLTVAFDQQILGKRYMPEIRSGQDWGMWLELTRDGAVARRYPGCHAVYCRSGSSLSSGKLRKALDIYRIYRQHENLSPLEAIRYLIPHALRALSKGP
jgi:glycosyltransferase involved in cell wall biosynthesis